MGNWKFLLQKEGEQNWHQLNEPTWDIEVGKYRLVGKGDRPNVNVEIMITHIITEGGKIKRCTRKRSRITNAQGLVLIIPFTQLQPGKWEINVIYKSTSDLASSSLETLQLLVKQKEVSHQNKKQNYSISLPIQKRQPTPQFQITLDQEQFVRQPREKILISGRVEGKQPLKPQVKPRLHYELKQPETGKILLEFQQNIQEEKIPLSFSYTLDLPRELETDSILGEVILEAWKKLASDKQEKVTLANKLFRIKTYINQQQSEEIMSSSKSLEPEEQPELISFFPSKTVPQYQPAGTQILPPKINRTSSKKVFKAPQLPQFFQKKTLQF